MKNTNKAKADSKKTLTGNQKKKAKAKTATMKNGVSKAQAAKEAKDDKEANKPLAAKGCTASRLNAILNGVNGAVTALDAMVAIYKVNGLTVKSDAKEFSALNKVLKAKLIAVHGKKLSSEADVQFRNCARSAKGKIIPPKPRATGSNSGSVPTASQTTEVLEDHRTSINGMGVSDFAKHLKSEIENYAKKNNVAVQDVLDAFIAIA